ncbi:hypothetical protein BV22DRAFT_1031705 [Leucogyrophana mollusca]|uniref:Uncharacterized protein n=1 Tax=Leucogyrophana mollusca TaxID=85980 RepID=A0ACB8BPY8_9AGAM|nr:hypothetical protein BV22DRAFT_1031705 [Leucogyrophana mollusca]
MLPVTGASTSNTGSCDGTMLALTNAIGALDLTKDLVPFEVAKGAQFARLTPLQGQHAECATCVSSVCHWSGMTGSHSHY